MITIIVAISKNNVIGRDNKLLWHLPNDLKRFKKITSNHPIIMGRKTFESIGKPLPNRTNIVISSQINESKSENLFWTNSIQSAIDLGYLYDNQIFIIGGGEVYKNSIQLADKLDVTIVDTIVDGDVYFPKIDYNIWKKVESKYYLKDDKNPFNYEFIEYIKK